MSRPEHLPFDAPLDAYEAQADQLLAGHHAGAPAAIQILHECLPRFLDPVVTWKPLPISDDEIRAAHLTPDDARLALARAYSFRDWEALASYVGDVTAVGSPVRQFESAVEAVINGDATTLRVMLTANPELVRSRSTRITCHDPAVHGAMLLHYIGANGVEGYRQRSPSNAVEIATMLLNAGAEVDAHAGMYGGQCTTMSMLISSSPPAEAGVQVALVNTLLDHGARIDGTGAGDWVSPIRTALIFGFRDAAEAVASRVSSVDDLVIAAGLGRTADFARLLPSAGSVARHEALAIAALNNRVDVVALLLHAGEDPNRMNPERMHAHQTPLHSAALYGYLSMTQLLVERGARMDIPDGLWNSTALGWARHGGQDTVAAYLASRGAT